MKMIELFWAPCPAVLWSQKYIISFGASSAEPQIRIAAPFPAPDSFTRFLENYFFLPMYGTLQYLVGLKL